MPAEETMGQEKKAALVAYAKKVLEQREMEAKLRKGGKKGFPLLTKLTRILLTAQNELRDIRKQYDKSEDDMKALQSVGQIIGEVLRQLDPEKCKLLF